MTTVIAFLIALVIGYSTAQWINAIHEMVLAHIKVTDCMAERVKALEDALGVHERDDT